MMTFELGPGTKEDLARAEVAGCTDCVSEGDPTSSNPKDTLTPCSAHVARVMALLTNSTAGAPP